MEIFSEYNECFRRYRYEKKTAVCNSGRYDPRPFNRRLRQFRHRRRTANGKTAQAQEDTETTARTQEDAETAARAQEKDTETAVQEAVTEAADDAAAAGSAASAETADFTPEDSTLSEDGSVIEFPAVGVTFTLPESFRDTKGFLPNGGGEINPGDGVYCMYYNYVALGEDDYEDLLVKYRTNSENAEKYENFFNPRVLGMFSVYAADGSRSADDINEYATRRSSCPGRGSR